MTADTLAEGRIIFQNEACMVINKLPGETSAFPQTENPAEGGAFPAAVHRLDTPVSGCLLLARTPEAAAFLCAAFARHNGDVEKHYWAIVEKPASPVRLPAGGELVHWLYEDKKANKSFAVPVFTETGTESLPPRHGHVKPVKAVLRCRVKGQGQHYLFVEIDLVTGRHHQIRAQLAALGLHIKGDLKYGARRSEKGGGIRLHAYSLAFPNPLNPGEKIKVNAPPPLTQPHHPDALWEAFAEAAAKDDALAIPPEG